MAEFAYVTNKDSVLFGEVVKIVERIANKYVLANTYNPHIPGLCGTFLSMNEYEYLSPDQVKHLLDDYDDAVQHFDELYTDGKGRENRHEFNPGIE